MAKRCRSFSDHSPTTARNPLANEGRVPHTLVKLFPSSFYHVLHYLSCYLDIHKFAVMEMYGMTGERLGTIGHEPVKPELEWKKALLTRPSVSVRESIAWGYGDPYEDTSTLVLTAASGLFVDVRFALSDKPTTDQAFWAFTGQSTTTFPASDTMSMRFMAHCRWDHSIDSKGRGISDEGDMFLLPNGDCMEVGEMENPQGKNEMYKEYWTGVPGAKSPCVVARSEAGVIIRIGNHCQGIAQAKGHPKVWVERWLRSPDVDEKAASWLKDWRSNTDLNEQVDVILPCMWTCGEQREEGDEITAKGVSWRIIEITR